METLNWHLMDPSEYDKLMQKEQQQPPARKPSFVSKDYLFIYLFLLYL